MGHKDKDKYQDVQHNVVYQKQAEAMLNNKNPACSLGNFSEWCFAKADSQLVKNSVKQKMNKFS